MRDAVLGPGAAMRAIEAEIDYAANSDAKVLITGESGVGKEVIARLVHQRSRRARTPLVTVNCAGVPDSLLEPALFGHVHGSAASTHHDRLGLLEIAHAGTVFFDEVGDLSVRLQPRLLEFLETGNIRPVGADDVLAHVDVRVIAASSRKLADLIAARQFRQALYDRLNVIHIDVPPLRARREDIPVFLHHFLRAYADLHHVPMPTVSPDALAQLVAYDWPGNVRELKAVVARLMMADRGDVITPQDLPPEMPPVRRSQGNLPRADAACPAGRASVVDNLFDRIVNHRESFWTAAYEPFMSRDLTREDLRALLRRGLQQASGNYKTLVELFNMDAADYKRFLNFLRKHDCQVPFQRFRPARVSPDRLVAQDV